MRRGRIITAVAALAGAAVVGVPGALAATPQQIFKDYADNGRLDGTYSKSDLSRALHDAVLQGYPPPTKKGLVPAIKTQVASGTTYGSVTSEDLPAQFHQNVGSQSGIYFFRLDGATGAHTTPVLIDDPRTRGGLQRFPDISVDTGRMHALWWDSRNDSCYSARRPIGNCADGSTVAALDAFAASGSTATLAWSPATRLSAVTSNPNWEESGGRTFPFGGDYLYISSVGSFSYGVWTDWRNVVAGSDLLQEGWVAVDKRA